MIDRDRATITVSDEFVDQLAARLAAHVALQLRDPTDHDGYLDPEAAGRYMGVSRKRVHDLTSSGVLIPDGHDGRKPLYRKRTLDAYVCAGGG